MEKELKQLALELLELFKRSREIEAEIRPILIEIVLEGKGYAE